MEPRFKEGDKLYIITRRDMSPGAQFAQGVHAKDVFSFEHPETNRAWYEQSNYICCLSVANEEELRQLYADSQFATFYIESSAWYEPDKNGEMTAVALSPGLYTKELCKTLPLALK